VWTDLFQHVERWIDGDRNAQIRLARAPWGPAKLAKRAAKYAVWLLIALSTGGAWIFYFADAPTLARDFVTGNAAFVAYGTVGVLTATTFIFGGFMREQVCIYMCPWPRIQSAMLDEKSLTVTYKDWRGEPRHRGTKKATLADLRLGDCIDCDQCVSVCPTGIDIREGPQVGCITCALCIDACDKVMTRIGRPRGLIDYTTFENAELERRGEAPKPIRKELFRPRTILYFTAWAAIGVAILFGLGNRTRLDISAQQDRNPLYVRLSDGTLRNGYTVKIRNMEARPRQVAVALEGLPGAVLWTESGSRESATRELRATVPADALQKLRIFVAASPGNAGHDAALTVRALDAEGGSGRIGVTFEGPQQ
jgi:cytochrome c oxidase accessory protein FixG